MPTEIILDDRIVSGDVNRAVLEEILMKVLEKEKENWHTSAIRPKRLEAPGPPDAKVRSSEP
jgi:hypothetical protein